MEKISWAEAYRNMRIYKLNAKGFGTFSINKDKATPTAGFVVDHIEWIREENDQHCFVMLRNGKVSHVVSNTQCLAYWEEIPKNFLEPIDD